MSGRVQGTILVGNEGMQTHLIIMRGDSSMLLRSESKPCDVSGWGRGYCSRRSGSGSRSSGSMPFIISPLVLELQRGKPE
jgi:hypothetical protein